MDKIEQILPLVIEGIQQEKNFSKKQQLMKAWPQIIGEKLQKHTKPNLLPNRNLIVWVDQSALGFELQQKYKQIIFRRAQAALGENEIKNVLIRIGQLR